MKIFMNQREDLNYISSKNLPLAAEMDQQPHPKARHRLVARREQERPRPYAMCVLDGSEEFLSKNKDINNFTTQVMSQPGVNSSNK